MRRAEFILAATLVFILFCMAVVMGCMPGGWVELAAGGTAGGAEGKLTDVWVPLGTWLDIGGVRFKVVFEEEPVTRMMQFTLIRPPAEIQKHHARLALGERELKSDDGSIQLTIKDYDFLVARGITWGGRVFCDISVRRGFNPSASVYSPELSFYRGMAAQLKTIVYEEVQVWRAVQIIPGIIRPAAFMAPFTTTLTFTGIGRRELEEPVQVALKVDWFPEEVYAGLSEAEVEEMRARRFAYQTLWVYPKELFKAVFELPDWMVPRAVLYARTAGTEEWVQIGEARWLGVERPVRVRIWDSWLENLNVEFSNVWQTVDVLSQSFEHWTENASKSLGVMLDRIRQVENLFQQHVQWVGEALAKHQDWTLEQLREMENWVDMNIRGITYPYIIVYAPQTAYAGVPNAFSIQPVHSVLKAVTVTDGSEEPLYSGISTFFTATPRVPGSGLKLKVVYGGEPGTPYEFQTFVKEFDISFDYLSAVTWDNNDQPVVAPPPEPVIQAWHLLAVGGAVFAAVLGVGLWRRR
jgi:hypothetical protein